MTQTNQDDELTDSDLLSAFESASLPFNKWRHHEHIRVAYLHLVQDEFAVAFPKFKARLLSLNLAHGVPDLPDRGYHETLTIVWLRLVEAVLLKEGPCRDSIEFCDRHPQLLFKFAPRFFYSREVITSSLAKAEFVPPDRVTKFSEKSAERSLLF